MVRRYRGWAMDEPVIWVRGLRRSYSSIEAVRGIDLEIQAGEVFAFLGPNGAGKTTTVEILEGYRSRDAGEVSVLGHDPARPTRAWYAHIGVVLQTSQVQAELTVRETVDMHAGYYPAPRPVDETIEAVGLTEQSNQRAGKLSGGQQRRLDVGLALVGDPALLFLDEPTTGLDPGARRNAWALIANLRQLGKTIFLTTHYMDEAQELADRVAIIVGGRIVAEGPPDQLGGDAQQPRTRILFRLANHADLGRLPGELVRRARVDGDLVELPSDNPVTDLHALTGWAVEHGADLLDLEVRRERLEDVYLQLTGEQ
jgi:ABC-2 type transport system ATP-binding protein